MSAVRDVQVALPPGWWGIDLDPAGTERTVTALLDRQFRGHDDLPHVKRELRRSLLDTAERARALGGMHLWLAVDAVGAVPVPASLLVSALPGTAAELGGTAAGPQELLDRVHDVRRGMGQAPERIELGLGPALRVRRRQGPQEATEGLPELLTLPSDGEALADVPGSTLVEFVVPVPDRDGCVVLSFSTPAPVREIEEALVELFDVMAATARWVR